MEGTSEIDSTLCKMILNSVQEGDLEIIKQNLEKHHVDIKSLKDSQKDQNAYFFAAVIKEDDKAFEVFKYLKSLDLDCKHKDKFAQTCLYYACREGKNTCCQFLVEECGLNPNEIDIYGQTPIFYCVRDHKIDNVKLMIELGTDINIEDKYGQTCLFYAIREGHYDIVELLIQKGANLNVVDKKKRSPYSFAEKFNFVKICDLLSKNGAILPPQKADKGPKGRREKKDTKKEVNNEQTIEEIQKPKNYILVKVIDGKKEPLNEQELEAFKKEHPEIYKLLTSEEERKKLRDSAPDSLLYCDSWEKYAKKLMNQLWKVKEADLFHKPVDPVELSIPDYPEVITNPMDFSTIKKKLNQSLYTNMKQFKDDIELTFNNCYKYNGERSAIGLACTVVKTEYQKIFDQLGMSKFE